MSDIPKQSDLSAELPPTNSAGRSDPSAPRGPGEAQPAGEMADLKTGSQTADTNAMPPAGLPEVWLKKFSEDGQEMRERLAGLETRLNNLEAVAQTTANQVGLLPPQVRMLIGKVDGVATSISEPRYRSLLMGLLGVYDLIDQVLRTLPSNGGADDHRRNYEVLRTQLRQLLEANGLFEIATEGAFDPALHRALQRVTSLNPSPTDSVLEVVRPGFRTEQAVLRYAEVIVSHYEPPETDGKDSVLAAQS